LGYLLQRAQLGEIDRAQPPGLREADAHRPEDLDALDRVDAEVGLHVHRDVERLDGVAGLVADDLKERLADRRQVEGADGWTSHLADGRDGTGWRRGRAEGCDRRARRRPSGWRRGQRSRRRVAVASGDQLVEGCRGAGLVLQVLLVDPGRLMLMLMEQ